MRQAMLLLILWGSLEGSFSQSQSFSDNRKLVVSSLVSAMHAEDDESNLDAAVPYYRKVVSVPLEQRVYAAYAQYRLAMIYLEKADVAAAINELQLFKRDFADYSDMVSVHVAEDHTNVFHTRPAQPRDSSRIGSIRNGRYHHNATSVEFDLKNWIVENEAVSSGGGETVAIAIPGSQVKAGIWLTPDRIAAADVPRYISVSTVQGKMLHRLNYENYNIPLAGIQPVTVGGKRGVTYIATYVENGAPMVEYFCYICTQKTRIQLFMRGNASDSNGFKSLFDVILSLDVP